MIVTIKMTTGAGLFVVWYIILTGLATAFAGVANALFYGLSLPLSGLFTLAYDEQILQQLSLRRVARWGSSKRRRLLGRLADERVEIIGELDALRNRYLAERT